MKFTETALKGVFVIELEKRGDDRGFFARLFCEREFAQHGLNPRIVQMNNSLSSQRGIRYNDPKLGIKWPMEPLVISDKDKNHPDFKPETHLK